MNAQSITATGHNIPGVVTGIIGKTSGDLSMGIHSEISSYLIIPFIKIFGFNITSIKLPFILASLGLVIVGYYLTKRMINEKAAVIAFTILAINPWLIFFGRSVYESILSSFFYLLSILLIINLTGWKKLLALAFLAAGFLSYFSAKTMVIPISLIASASSILLNKNKDIKTLVALNLIVFVFVGVYSYILPKTPAGVRVNEFNFAQSAQNVVSKRTTAIDSVLSMPFENKITEELRQRLSSGFGEFNPNYLFLNGQPEQTPSLSIPDHGFLYLIDAVFILLGIFFMARKYPKQLIIFISLLVVTVIPNSLDLQGTTYSIRTVILFPILAIISGIGFYSLSNRYIKTFGIVIYVLLFLNFFFIYFYRMPVERSEGWFLSQRVVSKYVDATLSKFPDKKIILITQDPKLTFYKYLFYTGKYINPKEISEINKKLEALDYAIGNLAITASCSSQGADVVIQSTSSTCPKIHGSTFIKSIKDSGDVFIVSNDLLCSNSQKNKFPLIKSFEDFKVEQLPVESLCRNYLSVL
jgi:hypothetical protein